MRMQELYIVYKRNTSNKLFESDDLESAAAFIERMNYEQSTRGDFEYDRYEIVRVVK